MGRQLIHPQAAQGLQVKGVTGRAVERGVGAMHVGGKMTAVTADGVADGCGTCGAGDPAAMVVAGVSGVDRLENMIWPNRNVGVRRRKTVDARTVEVCSAGSVNQWARRGLQCSVCLTSACAHVGWNRTVGMRGVSVSVVAVRDLRQRR